MKAAGKGRCIIISDRGPYCLFPPKMPMYSVLSVALIPWKLPPMALAFGPKKAPLTPVDAPLIPASNPVFVIAVVPLTFRLMALSKERVPVTGFEADPKAMDISHFPPVRCEIMLVLPSI